MSAPTVAVSRAHPHQTGHYGTYQRRPGSSGHSAGAAASAAGSAGTPRSFQHQHQQPPRQQPQHQHTQSQPLHQRRRTGSDASRPDIVREIGRADAPQNTPRDAARSDNNPPLSRPRRLSNSSGASGIPVAVSSTSAPQGPPVRNGPPPRPPQAFGPPSMRPRSSSWGSTSPAAQSTAAWRLKPYRAPRVSSELIMVLPDEVMARILRELKTLHLGAGAESCATCWMRDLCSLSLVSRKWLGPARTALYSDIRIIGLDSAAHKKKYKLVQGSRLVLLRRSIRANPPLGALVRSLKVPAPLPGTASRVYDEYLDLAASVVMACPNLESLTGLASRYNHRYSRLFHALSTRRNLRRMDWFLEAPPTPPKKQSSRKSSPPMVSPDMSVQEAAAFLDAHASWSSLTSLTIHCQPNAPVMPASLLDDTLARLPSLKHLHLSHVPAASFGDDNLLALPASLISLSLSHTPGITPAGLSAFATRSASQQTLTSLTLRHVRLDSLAGLARILSNLASLETLSVVLVNPPALDEDTFIWLMPYLASPTLKKLHWDMTSQAATPTPSGADSILARSIAANGFPALRHLRVLNDPDGAFQSLCRPVERMDLPSDRYRVAHPSSSPSMVSPASLQMATPTSPMFSPLSSPPYSARSSGPEPLSPVVVYECTNLVQARRAAQSRLEAAHYRPKFVVNVVDHDGEIDDNTSIIDSSGAGGVLVDKFNVGGFIGTIGSAITYHLVPDDHGGSETRGGLVDVEDLMYPAAAEDVGAAAAGCIGRWNSGIMGGAMGGAGAHYEKGNKQSRWWHTERARWASVAVA